LIVATGVPLAALRSAMRMPIVLLSDSAAVYPGPGGRLRGVEILIAWCAFFGGWLLVAGPLTQAALELREEDIESAEIEATSTRLRSAFPQVSRWWWLLPPVYYWRQRRRSRRFREAVMRELTPEQLSSVLSFVNTATGWLFVAGGASLIAVKETWELAEAQHWPHAVFWVLVVVMVVVCTGSTAVRLARTGQALGQEGRARTGRRRS
jgi:hypothetical protein